MPNKPAAEIAIDAALVRALVVTRTSIPDAATRTLTKAAEGWDCEMWRFGDDLAVRLPRRPLAGPLVRNEQRVLPGIAARIRPTGLLVPEPVFSGEPEDRYPWPWSVVPWIEGSRGIDTPRAGRRGWATLLADALGALHVPAPPDYPVNAFRGVPFATRTAPVEERLAQLRAGGSLSAREAEAAASVWGHALAVEPWGGEPVWIHGDLHPANLIARGPALVGIVDFGDVTAGDPAYDLAIAWLAFDEPGCAAFISATEDRYDGATWIRARGWAASIALMLLAHSDDEPAYAALGREAVIEVIAGR